LPDFLEDSITNENYVCGLFVRSAQCRWDFHHIVMIQYRPVI